MSDPMASYYPKSSPSTSPYAGFANTNDATRHHSADNFGKYYQYAPTYPPSSVEYGHRQSAFTLTGGIASAGVPKAYPGHMTQDRPPPTIISTNGGSAYMPFRTAHHPPPGMMATTPQPWNAVPTLPPALPSWNSSQPSPQNEGRTEFFAPKYPTWNEPARAAPDQGMYFIPPLESPKHIHPNPFDHKESQPLSAGFRPYDQRAPPIQGAALVSKVGNAAPNQAYPTPPYVDEVSPWQRNLNSFRKAALAESTHDVPSNPIHGQYHRQASLPRLPPSQVAGDQGNQLPEPYAPRFEENKYSALPPAPPPQQHHHHYYPYAYPSQYSPQMLAYAPNNGSNNAAASHHHYVHFPPRFVPYATSHCPPAHPPPPPPISSQAFKPAHAHTYPPAFPQRQPPYDSRRHSLPTPSPQLSASAAHMMEPPTPLSPNMPGGSSITPTIPPSVASSTTSSTPAQRKKYVCKTCSKKFSRPSSLKTHMHSHTGERPYACVCGRRFSVLSNLRRHGRVCAEAKREVAEKQNKTVETAEAA